MTDVVTSSRPKETPEPDRQSNGLLAKYAALPAPVRWMAAAAIGILVLSIVQEITGEGSSVLTEPGTSGAMLRFAVPILLAGLGGLLHAVATVSFGVDHIISGVAINILAPGLTRFLSDQVFSDWQGGSITQSPRAVGLPKFDVPFLAGQGGSTSVLGEIDDENLFFISDVAGFLEGALQSLSLYTVIAFALVPISGFVLWRTRLGLRIRICGERPEAGESLGVNIYLHKYIGVVTSGAFAGLAGGFVAMELAGIYREGQTLGRGYIGLAALIFGNWRPGGVMLGSLLFGYPFVLALRDSTGLGTRALLLVIGIALTAVLIYSLVNKNQTDAIIAGVLAVAMLIWWSQSTTAPNWLPNTMPYATVLLVLVFMSQRLRMPAADGQIYRKGG